MITWKKYTPTVSPIPASELGDGNTSGVWKGLEVDATNMTGILQIHLPLAAQSTGRVITLHTLNPGAQFIFLTRTGTDRISFAGADQTSLTTISSKVTITVTCNGIRWMVFDKIGTWT